MKGNPELSIVIAAFNSEKLLPRVLKAVFKQTYPKLKLEVIVVDGGSSDKTVSIGRQCGARIVKNPRTEPVYGKFLGYIKARGKFVMYLDHDEVLVNKKSLQNRISALKENPDVKAIAGGNYLSPKGYPFINDYINDFGDPFSFFMYRISKRNGFYYRSMKVRYLTVLEKSTYAVFNLAKTANLPITELVAGGATFDAKVLKNEFPETKKDWKLLPHFYYILHKKYPQLLITKKDPILHYSSDNFEKYFKKLKWRIKNNIFFKGEMGASGFSGRQAYQSNFQNTKKYLFLPYVLSVIFPLFDSIYLSLSRKNIWYMVHVILCLYMGVSILTYYVLRAFGYKPFLRSYDESKVVKNR